jgi:hypothetical protein
MANLNCLPEFKSYYNELVGRLGILYPPNVKFLEYNQYGSAYYSDMNTIVIDLCQIAYMQSNMRVVLAHEMYHAWQHQEKHLKWIPVHTGTVVVGYSLLYKEKPISERYRNADMPHERRAIKFENREARHNGWSPIRRGT